ncbi:unnamed protein product [Pleuronectes platessa]|uniref:Uncharacterized protein n=1 Tax=Pleuronectes platessa TaxID=8262 RepID=A0A9N7Z177_PLEPL|nr:unnamed protein product [Pleuronectes platessa]
MNNVGYIKPAPGRLHGGIPWNYTNKYGVIMKKSTYSAITESGEATSDPDPQSRELASTKTLRDAARTTNVPVFRFQPVSDSVAMKVLNASLVPPAGCSVCPPAVECGSLMDLSELVLGKQPPAVTRNKLESSACASNLSLPTSTSLTLPTLPHPPHPPHPTDPSTPPLQRWSSKQQAEVHSSSASLEI